jgi:hypothetical protein
MIRKEYVHLVFFSENLGAVSEEQGELFHQDIKEMERRYQGQWNVSIKGDYSWTLHHDILETSGKRKSNIHSFASNRKREYKASE